MEKLVADLLGASVKVCSPDEFSGFDGSVGLDATPELSITSVQKEIASSVSAELEAGTGRPWLIFAPPLAQLGFGTWRPGHVAGITQQRLDFCDAGYIKQ